MAAIAQSNNSGDSGSGVGQNSNNSVKTNEQSIGPSSGISAKTRIDYSNNNIEASDGKENLTAIRGGIGNINDKTNSTSSSKRNAERLGRRSSSLQSRQQQRQHQQYQQQSQVQSRQDLEVSDGDELVDSESERAELEEIERRRQQNRTKEAIVGIDTRMEKIPSQERLQGEIGAATTSNSSNNNNNNNNMHTLRQMAGISPPSVAAIAKEGNGNVSTTSTVVTPPVKPGRGRPRGRGRGAAKSADGRSPAQATSLSAQMQTYPPPDTTPKSITSSSLADGRMSHPIDKGSTMSHHPISSVSQAAAAERTSTKAPHSPFHPHQILPSSSSSSSITPAASRDAVKSEKYAPPFRPQPPATIPSPHSVANEHIARKVQSTFHKSESGSKSKLEDLTYQEVDKFMDLIEKHNLHTSNEDEMARSVTELYQEWLEWCAKKNISSTKSKQALVAEFVRIHQGDYGHERQQRAVEIVKGSGVDDMEGDAIDPHTGRDRPRRGSALLQPSSLPTAPSPSPTHVKLHHNQTYKGDEREVIMVSELDIFTSITILLIISWAICLAA